VRNFREVKDVRDEVGELVRDSYTEGVERL
jgi:hypothetical protein